MVMKTEAERIGTSGCLSGQQLEGDTKLYLLLLPGPHRWQDLLGHAVETSGHASLYYSMLG